MAKRTKKPYTVDVVKYGTDLAVLKRNKPRQFKRLKELARRRGVTLPSLVSGAPASLQERSPRAIRRQAQRTIDATYKPLTESISRRDRAVTALAAKQSTDAAAYRQWLDGQTGLLRAQARAADAALTSTQDKIRAEYAAAQASTTTDLAKRIVEAGGVSDTSQSTALAQVPEAQRAGLASSEVSQEHSAALQRLNIGSSEAAIAALAATAPAREAQDAAALAGERVKIRTDEQDVLLQKGSDAAALRMELRGINREVANANREFGLAMSQLGIKRQEISAALKEAKLDYKMDVKEFNLDRWIARNKAKADKLKLEIEYDKIAAQDGRAAADRALRKRIEEMKEQGRNDRDDDGGGGGGGATAAEREASREAYSAIQTLKTVAEAKFRKGKTERQVRLELIRAGATDVQVDVAFDLRKYGGKLSAAGIRKAKAAGVLNPRRFWDKYTSPTAGQGQ
jgi:myosin heavy subunit